MPKTLQKILIVDDSPISRKMLKSCFPKERGFEFHEAGDGQQGLDLYKELRPDLVTLDLTMPVMDGVTALAEIRAFDPLATVIVCTADVQEKSRQEVTGKGAFLGRVVVNDCNLARWYQFRERGRGGNETGLGPSR